MKQEFIDLVEYRLEKARNTLSDAQKYIDQATLESTVNRIYYALFYSVNALLITKKLSFAKHAGVIAYFNKEFINKNLIPKQFGEFFSDMFKRRQRGDYQDFVKFEKVDVKKWLVKAEEFLNAVEKLTREEIGKISK